jgi:hypothetical protein
MDNHARDAAVRRVRLLRYAILAYPAADHRRLFEWLHADNPSLPGRLAPSAAAWHSAFGAQLAHALLARVAAERPTSGPAAKAPPRLPNPRKRGRS